MKRWPASNELNWNLNEHLLNEAIANFGHVDMDGVLMLSRGEQSKCLPARSVFLNEAYRYSEILLLLFDLLSELKNILKMSIT